MQFIKNGPDIPEHLLQAHEEGKVVFFCGAGISSPVGLPSFEGLVRQLYKQTKIPFNKFQMQAMECKQFDTAIGSLEACVQGGRKSVREKLFKILTPKKNKLSIDTTTNHRALLTLGKTREGQMRLVTTNFDRIFEEIIIKEEEAREKKARKEEAREKKTKKKKTKKKKQEKEQRYRAPLLPIPKKHWNGLVYLHGLLPTGSDSEFSKINKLDQLVISSGDFGLAYLTERWASRFVSELFRNYTVCFVGYSINDPVLRYMMDALAADRLRGEILPEMFAFGDYSNGEQEKQEKKQQWKEKNVTSILYRNDDDSHSYLRKTLHSWSETYRDGLEGKIQIVEKFAKIEPSESTEEDDFVGRMLWALNEPKGVSAKEFANFNKVASLNWLNYLSKDRYGYKDRPLFGIPKNPDNDDDDDDDDLTFSFIKRPVSYYKTPSMALVNQGTSDGRLDDNIWHLGRWLLRHLNDPQLALWVAEQGGCLHDRFALLIQEELKKIHNLEKDNKQEELEQMRLNSPKAIPSDLMRTLWELILFGLLKQSTNLYSNNLFQWFRYFNLVGLTPSLRMELREILKPRIKIHEPLNYRGLFNSSSESSKTDAPQHMRDLVEWKIVLSADHVHSTIRDKKENSGWQFALPHLLDDFTLLLQDALDLMRTLGGAENTSDLSYIHQPFIREHEHNNTFNDWTVLIDLTRDAWLAAVEKNTKQARLITEKWWEIPYPLFKRLAFFAATEKKGVIPWQQALSWLLADDNWWLWSVETEREAIRLLAFISPQLDTTALRQLEAAILQGPPREMYRPDIKNEEWKDIVDETMRFRLEKLQTKNAKLSRKASSKLELLREKHLVRLEKYEQDRSSLAPVVDGDLLRTSSGKDELIEALRKLSKTNLWGDTLWRERCKQDFEITSGALIYLAKDVDWSKEGGWLGNWWRHAFSAWTDDDLLKKSWKRIPKAIIKLPDSFIQAIAKELSWWLEKQANKFEGQERLFFDLANRILGLEHERHAQVEDDPLFHAINHPVGATTEALLKWWYRSPLKDRQELPDGLKLSFTNICIAKGENFHPGKTALAAHVINLFRVDEEWTSNYFLRLFDWEKSPDEAYAVWVGFLRSPRLHWPLIVAIKQPFLVTAKHYEKFHRYPEQYTSLLTNVALNRGDVFTPEELSGAIHALPKKGILSITNQLTQALERSGEQRRNFWSNRVKPYFELIWPNPEKLRALEISASLAQLCVAAKDDFPEALKILKYSLRRLKGWKADSVVHKLHEDKLSELFPEDALAFLDAIIHEKSEFSPHELSDCLNVILKEQPDLESDRKFRRLFEISKINQ